jgi:hypothetical protein
MRQIVSILSLLLLGLAAPVLAQPYPSPQTAQRSGRWVYRPRAAVAAAPLRSRISVREVPAPAPTAEWEVSGYRWPLCGRAKVRLGEHLIAAGSPRPVLTLRRALRDSAAVRVVTEIPAAPAPVRQEGDWEYVPDQTPPPPVDEAPVFGQPRDVPPPTSKAPPVPMPREAPPPPVKVEPRATEQRPGDDRAAPPPPVPGRRADDAAWMDLIWGR